MNLQAPEHHRGTTVPGDASKPKNRSIPLYRDPAGGKVAPDEEPLFIREQLGGRSGMAPGRAVAVRLFAYHPKMGGYPDLSNHLGLKLKQQMSLIPKSRSSRILLALYLVWGYANVYVLLLGGAMMNGAFNRGHAFYPYTYLGDGEGLHLDWGKVSEYDCVEFFLYVLGPLLLYIVGRLIFVKGHDTKQT